MHALLKPVACCLLAAALVCSATLAAGGENGEDEKVLPELPPDPEVARILDSLGENQAAMLPPIKVVGEFNDLTRKYNLDKRGPGGRDFTCKMAWAPDRKRAFFCGANHGVPHKLNDVWEYDLAANTWALHYPPDFNYRSGSPGYDLDNVVLREGRLMTKAGAPMPGGHTWWQMPYDPEIKAMLWKVKGHYKPAPDAELEKRGMDLSKITAGPNLWGYFPYKNKWKPLNTEPPYPGMGPGGILDYIPDLKGSLHYNVRHNGQLWLYESAGSWKELATKWGDCPRPAMEQVATYDSDNKIVVVHVGPRKGGPKRTVHYDIESNSWSKAVEVPADDKSVPYGHDGSTPIGYDPVGKVCLMFSAPQPGETQGIWSYSVKEKKWTQLKHEGPAIPEGKKRLSYFDPARNVFVVTYRTTAWAYRYKQADKEGEK